MQGFVNFLANNYFWFLVITIILIFALIGYIVDQNEQKKGVSLINKDKTTELDLEDLAKRAQNKSLNSAISDSLKNNNLESVNNTITDTTTNTTVAQNNIEVLTK